MSYSLKHCLLFLIPHAIMHPIFFFTVIICLCGAKGLEQSTVYEVSTATASESNYAAEEFDLQESEHLTICLWYQIMHDYMTLSDALFSVSVLNVKHTDQANYIQTINTLDT